MNALALYVHWPYCLYKCHYCDFNSYAVKWDEKLEKPYLDALFNELSFYDTQLKTRKVKSIFLGGGTPSLFSPNSVESFLQETRNYFDWDPFCEVTIEANPKTIDARKIEGFLKAGVNRISLGVQSFEDRYLSPLGRLHSGQEAREAIEHIQKTGCDFNIDLMFGFPEQTLKEVLKDLEIALSYHPTHLSFYHLTLEEGTLFTKDYEQGRIQLPPSDASSDMMEQGASLIESHGLSQYEISNFSLAEKKSIHNLAYWNYEDYLGLGAGAFSFLKQEAFLHPSEKKIYGLRWMQPKKVADYFRAPSFERNVSLEEIDFETAQKEFWMMGLRLNQGVSLLDFEKRFGKNEIQKKIALLSSLRKKEWLSYDSQRVWLSSKGRLLANEVIEKFF
ncbi:MAG: radical SAM family heme chaperone HemW [Deltaproteobacteria bacterium]|nr:radical SAM family heme chaperone HemW [Deltaproteobacteria bacterium]